jgi:hypothetical protein
MGKIPAVSLSVEEEELILKERAKRESERRAKAARKAVAELRDGISRTLAGEKARIRRELKAYAELRILIPLRSLEQAFGKEKISDEDILQIFDRHFGSRELKETIRVQLKAFPHLSALIERDKNRRAKVQASYEAGLEKAREKEDRGRREAGERRSEELRLIAGGHKKGCFCIHCDINR